MSDNMNKALADALTHGTGVLHGSDYVAYDAFRELTPSVQFFAADEVIRFTPSGEIVLGEAWLNNPDGAAQAVIEGLRYHFQQMLDKAAAEERAKIVAWLRSGKIVLSMDGSKEDVAASAIEAKEHLI